MTDEGEKGENEGKPCNQSSVVVVLAVKRLGASIELITALFMKTLYIIL